MNRARRLAAVALLGCAGCAWVPDQGQRSRDRGTVPVAVRAQFSPRTTTRADVLCALGDPDWMRADESRFAYRARVTDGYFFIYLVGGLGVFEWATLHSDLFEFDRSGVLVRHRHVAQACSGAGDGGPSWPEPTDAEMEALFEERAP